VSDPLATPDDLGVYLGTTVDPTRAGLVLELAQGLCETVTSPLPAAAKGTVLGVAARAYNNVTSAHQAGIGSAQVSYGAPNSSVGIGGLFLSKTDIKTLRRLAGRTGAFSIDLLAQTVPPTDAPTPTAVTPSGAVAGDIVLVDGYGFTGTTTVTIGGVSVEFFEADDTRLYAVVPSGTAGDTTVTVTNAVGVSDALTFTRG
jgi:hypothetical protein